MVAGRRLEQDLAAERDAEAGDAVRVDVGTMREESQRGVDPGLRRPPDAA